MKRAAAIRVSVEHGPLEQKTSRSASAWSEGGLVIGHTYEIRVVGLLGPTAREAFTDVTVEVEPSATVLCADLDQSGLHALLDRVRALGLELMDIRQTPDLPPA
jgi:hypothetical protein